MERLRRVTRNAHLWLPGYVRSLLETAPARPERVWLLIADHFEPYWGRADASRARTRVQRWRDEWPAIAGRHQDSLGRRPIYTFFYPQEEYDPHALDLLAEMAREGIADVEVHLHHDGQGEQDFRRRIEGFLEVLRRRHGLLRELEGRTTFAFIHGNWALDNSRPDGRLCGLDNEIRLLRDLGCYADYTMPAAPDPCQGGPVNRIFTVTDDPARPRSHDDGIPVAPGSPARGDLTLIPGPLALDFTGRGFWRPRTDTGELAHHHRVLPHRIPLWIRHAPRLGGDVFVKLFAHGAQERNADALLGGDLDRLFDDMEGECRRQGARLVFATAWQMWRGVEAVRQRQDPMAVLA
jgi:hypothetical protein